MSKQLYDRTQYENYPSYLLGKKRTDVINDTSLKNSGLPKPKFNFEIEIYNQPSYSPEKSPWAIYLENKEKVIITFEKYSDQGDVSEKSLEVLRILGALSENFQIKITSVRRTPEAQATIMYDNIKYKSGIAYQRKLYKNANEVIDIYEQNENLPKDQVVKLMVDKMHEIGLEKISKHCMNDPRVNIFDIAHSSLLHKSEFYSYASKLGMTLGIQKILNENSCYHIEIIQY